MVSQAKWLHKFPWATLGRRESWKEFSAKIEEQSERVSLLAAQPLFSLVIAVTDPSGLGDLQRTLDSLLAQSYGHWEVRIVLPLGVRKLESYNDRRFVWNETDEIDAADLMNIGFTSSLGEWVAPLLQGDILSPVALFFLAEAVSAGEPDVLYANEVVVHGKRSRVKRYLSKREWSWFTLLHFNYLGRFWVMKRSLLELIGGWDLAKRDAADHDLLLRASEVTTAFQFLPLYLSYGEAASNEGSSESVRAHLARIKFPADVRLSHDSLIQVFPRVVSQNKPLLSVVICFRDRAEWTIRCLKALARQVGDQNVEVILVDNQSQEGSRALVSEAIELMPFPAQVVRYPGAFNFARMHNIVVRQYAKGEVVLLLNNDVFLSGEQNLESWLAWARLPWVGTVGILLRHPDGSVQHGGLRARPGGSSRLARVAHATESPLVLQNREVFGSSFAACMVKKSTYLELGGLDELHCPNGFGDVAFNFECLKRGLKNLYLGSVEGIHLESASRGSRYEYWEERYIERHYPEYLEKLLHADLGVNRVPSEALPLAVKQAVAEWVRDNLPGVLNRKRKQVEKALGPDGLTEPLAGPIET